MKPHYYAALTRQEDGQVMMTPGGPLSSYGLAIERHAEELSRMATIRPPKYERRVLLDLGTLNFTEEEAMQRVLMDDPVLKAVFELGRRMGWSEGRTA